MEVTSLPNKSLRIKGKHAIFITDPGDKQTCNGVIFLHLDPKRTHIPADSVCIAGAGEYEIGGVKITGVRSDTDVLYTLFIDGIECLLGKASAIEKISQKLKEHNIVIAYCDSEGGSSLGPLAANALLCYGDLAQTVAKSYGAEQVKNLPKYQTTIDKLPSEMETVLIG
jgi:hypothetical protein